MGCIYFETPYIYKYKQDWLDCLNIDQNFGNKQLVYFS